MLRCLIKNLLMVLLLAANPVAGPFAVQPVHADDDGDKGDRDGDHDGDSDNDNDHDGDSGTGGGSKSGASRGGTSAGDSAKGPSERSRKHQRNDGLDDLKSAVAQGAAQPLGRIRTMVRRRYGMEIINVDVERKHGRWVYEFKAVSKSGRVVEIYVDAQSGNILKVEDD